MWGSIIGAGLGLLGSKMQGDAAKDAAQQAMPINQLPPRHKQGHIDAEKRAHGLFDRPYQGVPMKRAVNPADDPFGSIAMWELQQAQDAKAAAPQAASAGGGVSPDAVQALREELMGRQMAQGMQQGGRAPMGRFGPQRMPANMGNMDYQLLGRMGTPSMQRDPSAMMQGIDPSQLSPYLSKFFNWGAQ